jgi:hypothetical protein
MGVSQSRSLQTKPEKKSSNNLLRYQELNLFLALFNNLRVKHSPDLQREPAIEKKAREHINSIFCEYEYTYEITLSKAEAQKYRNLIYIGILFYANRESMQSRYGGLSVELYDISMFYSFVELTKSQIAESDYTQNKINFMKLHRTWRDIIVFNDFTQNFLRY